LLWPFGKEEINNLLSKIERIKHLFNLALQNENLCLQLMPFVNFRALVKAIKDDMKSVNDGMKSVNDTVRALHLGHECMTLGSNQANRR
jgi:hypothetical protein